MTYDDVRPRTTAGQPAAFTPARWCRDYRLLNTARTSERNKLVSCTSDPSSCSLREVDTVRRSSAHAVVPGSLSRFCLALRVPAPSAPRGRARARTRPGAEARRAPVKAEAPSAPSQWRHEPNRRHDSGRRHDQGGGMSGTGGSAPPVVLSKGGVMLRLLTQRRVSRLGPVAPRHAHDPADGAGRCLGRRLCARWERAKCP